MKYFKFFRSPRFEFYVWAFKVASRPGKTAIFLQIFDAFVKGAQPIVQVYLVAKLINEIVNIIGPNGGDEKVLFLWFFLIVLLDIFFKLFNSIKLLFSFKYNFELQTTIEAQIIEKVYSLSQEQFDSEEFNRKLSKANHAKDSLHEILQRSLQVISASIAFLVTLIAVTFASPLAAAALLVTIAPSLLIQSKVNNRKDRDETTNDKDWHIMSRTAWVLSDPTKMPEIRLLGSFKVLVGLWRNHKKKIYSRELKTLKWSTKLMSLAELLRALGEVAVNFLFLKMVISGALGLDGFLFLRGLLAEMASSAQALTLNFQGIHKNALELNNLKIFLQSKSSIKDGNIFISSKKNLVIEFKNVSFRYPNKNDYALKNVSFRIEKYRSVALVGQNGAGKSSIIRLLLRQYLPTSGQILINGHDIKDINISSFYKRVALLMQTFFLVEHLSIAENIRLGSINQLSDDDIRSAATHSGAHDFIVKLKYGYNQRLLNSFDDGSQLSGGELQRISLARTLARQSDFLLLDEPTSAIDSKGELEIFRNIYKAQRTKSTLIVSHRFSTVRNADIIYVIDKGQIVEAGTHDQLIARNSLYREMFDIQADGYK